MSGPGLIADYLGVLARQLPGPVVEELADGLEQTYEHYLAQGLPAQVAAEAAVAEFGAPELIAAEFTRAHPAHRAARRLLAIGPAVGSCWAIALVTGRAWAWPVPAAAAALAGLALAAVIGLLAVAARSTRYRSVGRAGTAACIGTAVLDASVIIGVLAADPSIRWAAILAIAASMARAGLSARLLRSALSRG